MYAILKKLILVVSSNKKVVYNISNGVVGDMKMSDYVKDKECPSNEDELLFDITKCHPEYVLDMLLDKKGDINSLVRSLYRNKQVFWINQATIYSSVAQHLITTKGVCKDIPCYSCPFSYLVHGEHCTDNGYRDEDSLPQDISIRAIVSSKEYIDSYFRALRV